MCVGDVFADHVAQRAVAVEIADFADEVRAPALADTCFEALVLVVGGQVVDALGQAGQADFTVAHAGGAFRVADLDVAVVEGGAGLDAEAFQRREDQLQRQRGGEFDTAQGAALAVERGAEGAGGQHRGRARRRHVAGHQCGEIVVVAALGVDVALEVLVEERRGHVSTVGKILLVGDVQGIGAPRIQHGVAAAGAGAPGRGVDTEFQRGTQLIHARACDLLGHRKAQRLLVRELEGQVQAGQPVAVGLAIVDGPHFATGRLRGVPVVGLRGLVCTLQLHANIAAHTHFAPFGIDVRTQPGSGDFFFHRPGLGYQERGVVAGVEQHVARHCRRHIPCWQGAETGEAEIDRCVLQVRRHRGLALRAQGDIAFGLGLLLFAIGVVDAHIQIREPAQRFGHREAGLQARALEHVFHARHLAVAGAVDGVGEEQLIRIGIIHARRQLREAVADNRHAHGVQLRHGGALKIVFQVQFVASGLGVVQVRDDLDGPGCDFVVPAEGVDLVFALVVHATHQRIDAAGIAADEGIAIVDAHLADVQAGRVAAVVVAQVELELVGGVDLLGFGVEGIERAGPGIGRAILQRGHDAVALLIAGASQGLDAIGEIHAICDARTLPLRVDLLPRFVQAHLVFLDRHVGVRVTDGQADDAVCELVDVADIEAVAVRVDVGGLAQGVALIAATDGDHALVVAQRAGGLHVHGARQALTDQAGIGGLVDGDAADQFGWILVEFHAAVVAGADHFAPIEQRGGKVR
ncbi:TonB-dependent receptor domain protein [Xanthomonas citri pv. mangiferaeindicae LMG 941]|nr:TonB-dependent receptor domain protein [Xanthomonas citri pv. mangiferaeindicae LMG 941]